jgi:hypothetical protein
LKNLLLWFHPPRFNQLRYHSILAPNAKYRSKVIPRKKIDEEKKPVKFTSQKKRKNRSQIKFAELIKKTLNVDIDVCPKCGGKMKIIAFVTSQKEVQRYLRGEKRPLETPQFAPARGSPQYNLFEEFDEVDETYHDEFS